MNMIIRGWPGTLTNNLTISNTAPQIALTDTTASAKSLTIVVDANLAQLRESAGAAGSLVVLDLVQNFVGIAATAPEKALHIAGAGTGFSSGATIELQNTSNANSGGAILFTGTSLAAGGGPFIAAGVSAGNDLAIGFNGSPNVTFTSGGNVVIGTTAAGANAAKVLALFTGTAPTTGPADTVQFYSTDIAAGHTEPSFYCEGTQVLATGQADSASSVRVKMRINGTEVTLLAI